MGAPPHDEETIERGLHMLALCSGRPVEASRRLEAQGVRVSKHTLARWRDEAHVDRYVAATKRVQQELAPAIAANFAEEIATHHEIEMQMLERMRDQVEKLDAKDLSGAIRNIGTAKGIATDKWSGITGRPMVHVQHYSADELLEKLAREDPTLVVDAEVVEPLELTRPVGDQHTADDPGGDELRKVGSADGAGDDHPQAGER